MLSVEPTDRLYLAVQSECGAEGGEEGGSLEFLRCISRAASFISIASTHRLAAREGEVEQGNIRIGSLAGGGRGACSSGVSKAPSSMPEQHTREQLCSSVQLRMDLHAHGQFPFLPGSLLVLLALFLLVLQGLGFLFELLAERDAVCGGGLASAVCDGGEMQVRWTNERRTMNCPPKRADSAAAGPWPGHGERCREGDGEAEREAESDSGESVMICRSVRTAICTTINLQPIVFTISIG